MGRATKKSSPRGTSTTTATAAVGDQAPRARRDGAASQQALLIAAVREFARNGYAGARIDAIAASAGVNKQLIYHYFGSKEDLYQAALERVYSDLREKERRLSLETLGPVDAMVRLVEFSFDYLRKHPEFIALLADENRNRGQRIAQSASLQEMHTPFVRVLNNTLARGVEAGVFRNDYDAVNLYISIAGISYFFFSNMHTLSAIFGRKLDSDAALKQRRQHVIALALNALNRPASPPE